MDTLKILLGATVALLLGALVVSYTHPSQPAAAAEGGELIDMQRQLQELQIEQDRLETERQRRILIEAAAARPVAQPAADPDEIAAMKAQIAELEREKERAERDAETADREAAFVGGKMLESRDQELRRARMIKDSLLIARIKEWVSDPQFGGFATLDIVMPENVQPGTVLCIRRNTGILGKLRVGDVSIEGAIANPLSSFPEAQPQPGDELILEPPFSGPGE